MQDAERLNKTSASSFSDDFACLGRRNFINSLPLGPDIEHNQSADWGTEVHLALETGDFSKLDAEQLETYEAILAQEKVILAGWNTEDNEPPACEERFWIHGDDMAPLVSAKLDRYWIRGWIDSRKALIIDVKSLYAPRLPRASNSWQLKIQAVCLWLETGIEQIRVAYNCPNRFGRKFDVADFSKDDLGRFYGEIKHICGLIAQPDAPRSPGPQCQYCPGKSRCPEAVSMSLLPSVVAQSSLGTTKADVEAKVASLGVPDLVYLWQRQSIIKNVLEAASDRLKALPEEALAQYGMKLAEGRDTSKVEGDRIREALTAINTSIAEDRLWPALSINQGKLTEIAQELFGGTKKAATEWVKEKLAPFKTESKGEKVLREL